LATCEILQRNGFALELPDFECFGIARISSGGVASATRGMEKNLKQILPLVEKGTPVIFSEPSCALAVKLEYPKVLGLEEATKIVNV